MSTFTSTGNENRMRWDRASTNFMEVWHSTLNHAPSGAGIWLRYTITAPKENVGPPYCELWGFYFDPEGKRHFGARQRFPIERLGAPNGRDDGALVRIGDAWLSENHLEGELERDGRLLQWSLHFEPADRCFQHLPERVRKRAEKRVSTLCSPNLSVPFAGSITIDGEVLSFEGELGSQSHRWGRRHSTSWAWAHCSGFESAPDAVFEGVSARAPYGLIPVPTLTFLYLRYEGRDISFTDLKWALRARTTYEMPTWAFTARNDDWKIVGAARAPIDRLQQVTYSDPDGTPRFCCHSEIADVAIEVYRRDGGAWDHAGTLMSMRKGHVEFGRRERFPAVPVVV